MLFTRDLDAAAYSFAPHQDLTRGYPCFPIQNSPSRRQLVEYFQSRLTEPDAAFAEQFEGGWYEQDRSFVRNIGETLARSTARPLVLLDNQRFGFALVKAEMEDAVFDEKHALQKKVIIVEGPPGSGKSVIAAKVSASLAADSRIDAGAICFDDNLVGAGNQLAPSCANRGWSSRRGRNSSASQQVRSGDAARTHVVKEQPSRHDKSASFLATESPST